MSAHQARKRFGQNFLHDRGVIDRIVRAIRPREGERIIEIGPGLGALTVPLLAALGRLEVIELDRDIVPKLTASCAGQGELTITQADALKVDYTAMAQGQMLRVVGNLPYNISSPLLFHLLDHADAIHDMHFMLQKEVVDRMCASAGDADYGRLSVTLAARANAERLFVVGPGAFQPAPKVDSAIVRLTPRAPDFTINDRADFEKLVTAAFSQRRKQLRNTLKQLMSVEQIAACDIDPSIRAEQLTPADFARLANTLSAD
ncbi:16S rRNA (adenine(1518)-N(6)/adenine(1519)-N(6))-dimethyltransferase RsmA [Polycyclovorans algicola]|uniref:16S rRNA (adenine(1518)-N(6)/adenine(1519)-N(6))- dimethyltransferase RsmA n=1 Tax=Polycyclovorans algicola TaxID=616992 RepID=UPI0004A737EB|nr:16S rRNA (adenine(1518)-N(6)/adenine(1519)-N(6))-dimethyltransferase RsmA [Polycyclovorans algicola]